MLQIAQDFQHGVGILAAGQAHHHLVALTDHIEIGNGTTDLTPQLLMQLVEAGPLFGVQGVHRHYVTFILRINRRYSAGLQRFR